MVFGSLWNSAASSVAPCVRGSTRWLPALLCACCSLTSPATMQGGEVAVGRYPAAAVEAAVSTVTQDDLKRHVTFLAGDALEGREAGSQGGRAAAAYLTQQFEKLGLRPAGDDGKYLQFFGNDYRNILGVLPGTDPQLKGEYVVVGAHYDHVGYGYSGNSLGTVGQIHNGADDNASGTAALLEIAQAIGTFPQGPRRSLLFVLWDGEELGLLGSRHWTANPTVPLKQVKFYINLDMLGRLRAGELQIYGSRTAPGARELVAAHNRDAIEVLFDWDLIPDSDHYPFLQQQVPFLMPFTGKHEDYHRPSDDADRVNYRGTEQLTQHWLRILIDLVGRDELPAFRETALREHEGYRRRLAEGGRKYPSRLGISWNSDESDSAGFLIIRSVSDDSPASRADLWPGDRVLSINGREFRNSTQFMQDVLASTAETIFEVRKAEADPDAEPKPVPIKLNGSPVRFGFAWREDDAEPGILILDRIVPNSPAERAGLKVDDRLLTLDGQRFGSTERANKLFDVDREQFSLRYERHGVIHTADLQPLQVLHPPQPESEPPPAVPASE